MDKITMCLYLQLIQFTITTVNPQGLLDNDIIIHFNERLRTLFLFPMMMMNVD